MADAMLIGGEPFYLVQRHHIAANVARLLPATMYALREMVEAGGLISYGTSIPKPPVRPGFISVVSVGQPRRPTVMQPTTSELVINLKAAKAQGIEISANVHARSDGVIE